MGFGAVEAPAGGVEATGSFGLTSLVVRVDVGGGEKGPMRFMDGRSSGAVPFGTARFFGPTAGDPSPERDVVRLRRGRHCIEVDSPRTADISRRPAGAFHAVLGVWKRLRGVC